MLKSRRALSVLARGLGLRGCLVEGTAYGARRSLARIILPLIRGDSW